jgi:hypothetical protein
MEKHWCDACGAKIHRSEAEKRWSFLLTQMKTAGRALGDSLKYRDSLSEELRQRLVEVSVLLADIEITIWHEADEALSTALGEE